jgi:SPP1 gp7 family putative phage head morphogenesis protein
LRTVSLIPATEFDLEKVFNERLRNMAEDNYYKVIEGYAPTIEKNIHAAGHSFKFDVSDPRIVGYIETKVNKVVAINETMRNQIRGAIEESLMNNETIGELQNRISRVMGDTRARSLRIARTETASAANGVEYESYRQAGVEEKMWIASLDEVTRDSHIEAMGQGNIPTNQVFSNGLMFPGEASAPVEEIVNCRCTLMATG